MNFENMINTVINGDSLEVLKTIPDCSVQCCITSPPYFGLRDYQTGVWEGGNTECNHFRDNHISKTCITGQINSQKEGGIGDSIYKDICKKCGAKRIDKQIGLENTPEEYVSKLVEVFREVKRILKNDGILWLNLGDSYASNGKSGGDIDRVNGMDIERGRGRLNGHAIIKPKDLIGIPWSVAFALRNDGWYLRQDIIWNKPNPMPESVTDRCTKSHEYIFLLAKSQKYYFDNKSIKEKAEHPESMHIHKQGNKMDMVKNNPLYATKPQRNIGGYETRNKRSVWTVNTKPFKESHFATFPQELVYPMILACCPENGIVLDCFAGASTTGVVALKLKRKFIGIELNPDYVKMSEKRLNNYLNELF